MARRVLCLTCAKREEANSIKFNEPLRTKQGMVKVLGVVCDGCNNRLPKGVPAACHTFHPQGHEVIMPWEHEYIEEWGAEPASDEQPES